MDQTIFFDAFEPDTVLGSFTETPDHKTLQLWQQLYPMDPAAAGQLPRGMATVLLMRAYMHVVAPRPPGNIHAGQQLEMTALPRLNERVTTQVRCVGKQLRKGRRFVELAAQAHGDGGRPLFSGRLKLIWAE